VTRLTKSAIFVMIFSCNFKPDHSSLRTDTGNRRSRIAPQTRDVAFTYQRSAEKAETTAKSINSTGRRTVAIQADSADPKAITQSVSQAVSALGGLDILVSSAAISLNGLIADIDVDDYQMLMDVNVRASVLFAKA